MIIQFNTDNTINIDKKKEDYFKSLLSEDLKYLDNSITRLEVHISDENGIKDGLNDIRCLIEARLEGKQPISVSNQADTVEFAVSGAIDKLKALLTTILDRLKEH